MATQSVDTFNPDKFVPDVVEEEAFEPEAIVSSREVVVSSREASKASLKQDVTGRPSDAFFKSILSDVLGEVQRICPAFEDAPEFLNTEFEDIVQESPSFTAGEMLKEIMSRVMRKLRCDQVKAERDANRAKSWVKMWDLIKDFKMTREVYEKLAFREHLVVSVFHEYQDHDNADNVPTPVGGLSLDIQNVRGGPLKKQWETKAEFQENKFLVHLSSDLDHNGNNGGSRITAWVDKNFQTLEEKRSEYIYEPALNEKCLHIASQEQCYYLRSDKKRERFYSPARAINLICEGASFILMRYLAVSRFFGEFECCTTYLNGDLCRNIYDCDSPLSGMVNGRQLDLCKIYRTIIEECGLVHKSVTLMTLQGQIVKHEWEGCDYVLHVNPLAEVTNTKPSKTEKVPLDKTWIKDMELFSRYLDKKVYTKKIILNYLDDYAEIKDLVKDYVTAILMMKPDDVLDFTARHFLNFVPHLMPRTEYFERDDKRDSFADDEIMYL